MLGGKCVFSETKDAILLTTYSADEKAVKMWHFNAAGYVHEWTGHWDDGENTLTLKSDLDGNPTVSSVLKQTFTDNDTISWSVIATDQAGKVYHHMEGMSKRRKPKLATNLDKADGPFYELPKDGTWATYQVDGSVKMPGEQVSVKGNIRMASVGQVTEAGQPCRWIEVVSEVQSGGEGGPPGRKDVVKVLIPEQFLVKGEAPLEHAIRAWRPAGKSMKRDSQKDKVESPLADEKFEKVDNLMMELRDGLLPVIVILSGLPKDATPLPKAEVESKLGKLQCEGMTGSLDIAGPGTSKMRCAVENRLHPEAPFGVVSSRWTIPLLAAEAKKVKNPQKGTIESEEWKEAGKVELNLKLIDFGDKATSEMPDAK